MRLSADELSDNALTEASLAIAVGQLKVQGYVILESVLPLPWIAEINAACQHRLSDRSKRRHRVVSLRREPPFNDPRIITNPFVLQISRATMGPKLLYSEYRILCCLPQLDGAELDDLQGVHRDRKHLFPELQQALPPWCVQACIALTDLTCENGATEIWPGTHLMVDAEDAQAIDPAKVLVSTQSIPSCQLIMPVGSIALLDMRMIHRAIPNTTDASRIMLAIAYHRAFGHLNLGGEPVLTAEEALAKRRSRKPQRR